MDRKMNVDYYNYDYNVYHTYEEVIRNITEKIELKYTCKPVQN